jgi:hypothetical protein
VAVAEGGVGCLSARTVAGHVDDRRISFSDATLSATISVRSSRHIGHDAACAIDLEH